jgi:hypothetical protein
MNARDLTNQLAALLRRERHAMADFLLALADFDRRRLWTDLGHASLFSFLRRELGLSAGAAQYRKTAVELIQRHLEVEAALRQGNLCLSSVIELAKVLTPDNVAEVLPRFFGLSRREAAAVAVSIRPVEKPASREIVTAVQPVASLITARVDQRSPVSPPAAASVLRPAEAELAADTLNSTGMGLPAAAPRRASVAQPSAIGPLDAERARLHITVSRRLLAKIEAAKAALSHSRPGASSEKILEAALDLLLAKHAKQKGLVQKPRKAAAAAVSPETIPAAVKREVWKRSGGCCEWPLESGGACDSTLRLELDHVTPRALGGPSTVANLRVLCRRHNDLAARQAFGDEWMDRFTRSTREADANAVRQREASAVAIPGSWAAGAPGSMRPAARTDVTRAAATAPRTRRRSPPAAR